MPTKLGDAYRAFLIKQESVAPFSKAIGTILSECLLDLARTVGLFVALLGALLTTLPRALTDFIA